MHQNRAPIRFQVMAFRHDDGVAERVRNVRAADPSAALQRAERLASRLASDQGCLAYVTPYGQTLPWQFVAMPARA